MNLPKKIHYDTQIIGGGANVLGVGRTRWNPLILRLNIDPDTTLEKNQIRI